MIRELDSDPLSTDHFNFRTLTSSTFNPFAGAKLKNFESWDGTGKNRRLKSLLQLIIYKFSLDFSSIQKVRKISLLFKMIIHIINVKEIVIITRNILILDMNFIFNMLLVKFN